MRIGAQLPRRVLAASVLSAALGVALTACGSSSPSTASATAAASTTSSSGRYQARLNLAKCLRSHGVNVPDPSPNGGPACGGGEGIFRQARSSPNFQSAMQACAQYQRAASPLANLSPAQRAQLQQDLVKFAQCMRAHNINIPDPTTSAGGGFGIFRQLPSSERNSPAFRSAVQTCSTNLPFRPGGRPGGGAPPPGGGAPPGA
jgi:hypothetical protein